MEKKSRFKKLLTTASAFAVIAGASTSAMGADLQINGNVVLNNNANFNPAQVAANNDVLTYSNNGFTARSGAAINGLIINTLAFNPGLFTVDFATGFKAVTTTGGAGLPVQVNNNIALTLEGGSDLGFAGLGAVTLDGANSKLIIDTNATLVGAIDGVADNNGIIAINGGKKVTFSADVGSTHRLSDFTIAAGGEATFDGNVTVDFNAGANGIKLANPDSKITMGAGKNLQANVISVGGAGNGQVQFLGASNVTGKIGEVNAVSSVKIGNGAVAFTKVVNAQSLLVTHANSDAQFAEDFTGNVEFSENGKVSVAAGKNIDGNATTTKNGNGNLVFAGNGSVTGNIGAAGNALKTVEITGAGTLQLTGAKGGVAPRTHYAETFLFKDNGAILRVAAGGKLVGNAVANGAGNGQITFDAAGEFTGILGAPVGNAAALALGKVTANGAGVVTVSAGNHKVNEFYIGNHANAGFTFKDGANITGAINSQNAANGAVIFQGDGSVSGTIGAGNQLNILSIQGAAGKVVSLGAASKVTTVNITNGGTLKLVSANGTHGTLVNGNAAVVVNFTTAAGGVLQFSSDAGHDINLQIANGSVGSVIVDNEVKNTKTITFAQIGNANNANALHTLIHDSAATVKFNAANSHITTVKIGNADAVLDFAAAGDYKIENVSLGANHQGTLKISHNITLKTAGNGVSFGTADKKLNALQFSDGKTLTLEDKINIYAKTLTNNAPNGAIVTSGDNTLDLGTQTNALDTLTVDGAAGTKTRLLSALNFNGAVTVDNDATLEITKNLTADDIAAANAGNGTVKFTNGEAITITGTVGAGNVLRTLEFAGSNVKFNDAVTLDNGNAGNATAVVFSGNAATTVELDDAPGGALQATPANFTNTSEGEVVHTLSTKTGINFQGDLSSANGGAKKINFKLVGVNAELSGNAKADGANFITSVNEANELNLNKDEVVVNSVGASGTLLSKVTFTQNGTIKNGTFAKDINVVAGKTATLGGTIESSNALNLAGIASKVIFSDNAVVNAKVVAGVLGEGLVEFAGSATVNKDIGTANTVSSVNFSDDDAKTVTLNAENIKAVSTHFKKGHVVLSQNVTLTGANVSARDANLTLNDKKLTVGANNTLTFNGTSNIKFSVNVTDKNELVGGNVVIAKTASYKAAADAVLVVNPVGQLSKRLEANKKLEFTLIDNSEGNNVNATDQFKKENVSILAGNRNIEYSLSFNDKNSLVLIGSDRTKDSVLEALNSSSINNASIAENVKGIFAASEGTDAGKFADLLFSLTDSNGVRDNKSTEDAITRLVNPTAEAATTAIEGNLGNVSVGLSTRTANLAGSSVAVEVSSAQTGIAAGDDQHRYGVWAAPFYNNTTQKARKGAAGYKSEAYGATFGFDTKANDDMIIGTALTIAGTDMKHKDFKSGDKTKINAYMFSIYGMQQLTNNWFVHAVATYGTNEVKNNSKRVSGVKTYEIVSSKYTANAFNAEAMFGYNFAMSQIAMTPMFGAKLTRVNDGGYKETGSLTGQNLSVTTKASNKLEVVAGAKVSYSIETNGVILNPEVHGFVSQDLIGKNPTPKVGIDGLTNGLATKTIKPAKTSYNLGFSINSEYNMMEYGLGYDAEMSNKRVGHQGTLKVRVNF